MQVKKQYVWIAISMFAIAILVVWALILRQPQVPGEPIPLSVRNATSATGEPRSDKAEPVVTDSAPASGPDRHRDLRARLLMTASTDETIRAGIFSLRPDQFWEITQAHTNPDIRRLGCMLSACFTYAAAIERPESTPGFNPAFSRAYCAQVVDQGNPRRFLDEYTRLNDSICTSEIALSEVPRKAEEVFSRHPISETEIVAALSDSTQMADLIVYTGTALSERKGIDGVDFVQLERLLAVAGNNANFNSLLALKFGCRIPGYCTPNSPVLTLFCDGGIQCMPGDDLVQIAQRNLPPAVFTVWQQANVKRPN